MVIERRRGREMREWIEISFFWSWEDGEMPSLAQSEEDSPGAYGESRSLSSGCGFLGVC